MAGPSQSLPGIDARRPAGTPVAPPPAFTPDEPFRPAWGAGGSPAADAPRPSHPPPSTATRPARTRGHPRRRLPGSRLGRGASRGPARPRAPRPRGQPRVRLRARHAERDCSPWLGRRGDGLARLQRRAEPRAPLLLLGRDRGPALRGPPYPRGRHPRAVVRDRLLPRCERPAQASRRDRGGGAARRRRGGQHAVRPRRLRPRARCALERRSDLQARVPQDAAAEGA